MYYGLTGSYSGPEVGFGEIAIDLLQARFWPINKGGRSVAKSAFIAANPTRVEKLTAQPIISSPSHLVRRPGIASPDRSHESISTGRGNVQEAFQTRV
jgi:hypothetical protein